MLDRTTTPADELLGRINAAVAVANDAERRVTTAQTEFVSRSRAVGVLLLEAKKLHPKVKDFEAFLQRVDGLQLSRAYDLMRVAGGRKTDEELRKETRDRVQKHRDKKRDKLPPKPAPTLKKPEPEPKPEPKPDSVTSPPVTEKIEAEAHDARWHLRRLMRETWTILNAEASWPKNMKPHRRDRRTKALKQFVFLQSELPNLMTPE
jgi:hypothetical protein